MSVRLGYRLQGLYRELLRALKPSVRAAQREASLARFRLRLSLSGREDVRVVCHLAEGPVRRISHPAITMVVETEEPDAGAAAAEAVDGEPSAFLERQTEVSVTRQPGGSYLFAVEGDPGTFAATHLEAMLMVAVALDLDLVLGGAAPPAADRFGPAGPVFARRGSEPAAKLVRFPGGRRAERPVVGRSVPHIGELPRAAGEPAGRSPDVNGPPGRLRSTAGPMRSREGPGPVPRADPRVDEDEVRITLPLDPGLPTAGPWIFSFGARPRGVVRQPVVDLEEALGELPVVSDTGVEGSRRTVLFLLPYLAVGGAEKLLYDLVRGLDGVRSVIVTLEPHERVLGQTVDRARELTPHVYTLGDWLPREAHGGALRHLLRRYGVETLMSWNGTTWFYDEAPALACAFPDLRLVNQLYNHRGGWIEHYRPSLVRALDCHVAVNRRIARALELRGVPAGRIRLIYHGVEVPDPPTEEERRRRRDERRRELGLPLDALVVGTFVRMHRQKRPLDVVRLARRFHDRGVAFLLVGSGPLDAELDREIAADPPPNLVRLPMRRDPEPLYDAVDLCLSTSSFEGLPVFLLDGLARGIPCVATAVGDVPVLLEEGGGIIVERPGDLDGLARALTAMSDPDSRAEEARKGRATVSRRFSVRRYVDEYLELLGGSPAPRHAPPSR